MVRRDTRRRWIVADGAGKNRHGVLVQIGKSINSWPESERLAPGAIVAELAIDGDRLAYELCEGSGPEEGWVTVRSGGKDLLEPMAELQALEDRPPPPFPWGLERALIPLDSPVKGPQVPLGAALPNINRSFRLPGTSCLDVVDKGILMPLIEDSDERRAGVTPRLYVLVIPGTMVFPDWISTELQAPADIEVATYEWPGHGTRREETRLKTVADLGADIFEAFREAMSTGSFIIVGHSIGCLLMTYVCARAQLELGVVPEAAFALGHTAPHQKVFTEYADQLAKNDPNAFAKVWNPTIGTVDMWACEEQLTNDTTPVGSYKYPCRLHVFIGMLLSSRFPKLEDATDESTREWIQERQKLCLTDNFDPCQFEEWSEWADDYRTYHVECDPKDLPRHNRYLTVLFREAGSILRRVKELQVLKHSEAEKKRQEEKAIKALQRERYEAEREKVREWMRERQFDQKALT